MEGKVPRVRLSGIHLAGCGHVNNPERPAEYIRILKAFFRRIGREG